MSTVSLPRHTHQVKHSVKFSKWTNPSREELPGLLAELMGRASLAPQGERFSILHLRTRLIEQVIPQWELPAFLDSIQGGSI